MKKLLITLITLALLVTLLASCGEPKPAEAYVNGTHLSEYTVVYSENAPDYNKRAAEYIAAQIKERCNIEIAVATDSESAAEHEIVVGETNRPISEKLNAECEGVEFGYLADGGSIALESESVAKTPDIYPEHTFTDIAHYCKEHSMHLWEYAVEKEGEGFLDYMNEIWRAMKQAIKAGLRDDGILPGGLSVKKKAKSLFQSQHIDESPATRENRMVCAYAFAVSEQNASGEQIVTAPTCGAAGVLPAVLYYQQKKNQYSDADIVRALITAGIIGNLIKTNASISGAECGEVRVIFEHDISEDGA